MDLENLGLNIKIIFFGIVGALVSLKYLENSNAFEKAYAIFCGAMIANFGTPAIISWWKLPDSYTSVIGFLLGLFGMAIANSVYLAIKQFSITEAIKRRLGGG